MNGVAAGDQLCKDALSIQPLGQAKTNTVSHKFMSHLKQQLLTHTHYVNEDKSDSSCCAKHLRQVCCPPVKDTRERSEVLTDCNAPHLWSSFYSSLTMTHMLSGNDRHCSSSGQEIPKLLIKPSQPRLALSQNDLQGRCTSPAVHSGAYTLHTKRRMSTEHTV